MGLPDLGLEPPTCELSLDKWMPLVFHRSHTRWLIRQPPLSPSHVWLSMQYSFCSLRICGTPGTPSALPDAARVTTCPASCWKKNHLDPLTSKAMEGKVMKEFFYWVYFFSFRKGDFKHNTTRQPGMVVHSYSPSTWEAKGRRSGVQGYPGLFSKFHPNSLKHMRPYLIHPKGCGLSISCAQNSSRIFLLTPCENGPISWSACVLAGRRN